MTPHDAIQTTLTPLAGAEDARAAVDFIGDASAVDALDDFNRFPTWMWRNTDVVAFVEWLREHNDGLPADDRVGSYGMDLYALHASMRAVLAYLDDNDPDAAHRARERYACFDRYGEDPQLYAYAETYGLESREEAVLDVLMDLQRSPARPEANRPIGRDERFFAEQNARLVKNAEEYYRTMFRGGAQSWNLRDQHMAATIEALRTHVSEPNRAAKIAVWAHNSHLGDARATQMGERGELNVGQLMRERFPDRRDLPARYRTAKSLFSRKPVIAVRRGDALRSHERRPAARDHRPVVGPGSTRDVSDRSVTCI